MSVLTSTDEKAAAAAFGKQAGVFDTIYGDDPMIQYKRKRVRDHVLQLLPPGSSILELNAGTGEDAIFFAEHGHNVHATDISEEMLDKLNRKANPEKNGTAITTEQCSFTSLHQLTNRGPFDLIFSNFAGLNCTPQLNTVLSSFENLVTPGGLVTLVVLPPFCLWETLLIFKGKFRTAFRRLPGKNGAKAHIEGEFFRCWYYSPNYILKHMPGFELIALEGLCTIVPPSYFQEFDKKYPDLYAWLTKKEDRLKSKWPWRSIGDYFIITLRKK